ncbi:hypothetical protein EP08_07350 [Escherichia coli]|nr:hypothetical protein EP08_07350 [Escherichia coli]
MIWQPEFTDKTLSRKPGAVQTSKMLTFVTTQPFITERRYYLSIAILLQPLLEQVILSSG